MIDYGDDIKKSNNRTDNANVNICVQIINNYSYLKKLVPQNCFVTLRNGDIVPGIGSSTKFNMPKPLFEKGKDKSRKNSIYQCNTVIKSQSCDDIYIHKVEIIGSHEAEKDIENMLTQMFKDKNQSSEGQTRDELDIYAVIQQRKLVIRMHNGWQYITDDKCVNLSPPD